MPSRDILNRLSRIRRPALRFAVLLLLLYSVATWPATSPAAAADSPPAPQVLVVDSPVPLPRGCDGVMPPGGPVPVCCMFGYIYRDGAPVSGVSVQIESIQGTRVVTTTGGSGSAQPYYAVDLSSAPLLVSAGEVITLTASYGGMRSLRTWTVQSAGQHVDLGLVTGYEQ